MQQNFFFYQTLNDKYNLAPWSELRIFLSQNFKFVYLLTFAVVLLMNQNFKNMFKSTVCSYL